MATEKTVKEYSNRPRINLNRKDGFHDGENVIVMSLQEYENLKTELFNRDHELKILKAENGMLNEMEAKLRKDIIKREKELDKELKNLLEVSLKPINETHKEQLEDKDNQIKQLNNRLNAMQSAFNHFITKINSLNTIDILFRKKHNQVINDFIDSIVIPANEDKIVNADVKQISEKNK